MNSPSNYDFRVWNFVLGNKKLRKKKTAQWIHVRTLQRAKRMTKIKIMKRKQKQRRMKQRIHFRDWVLPNQDLCWNWARELDSDLPGITWGKAHPSFPLYPSTINWKRRGKKRRKDRYKGEIQSTSKCLSNTVYFCLYFLLFHLFQITFSWIFFISFHSICWN